MIPRSNDAAWCVLSYCADNNISAVIKSTQDPFRQNRSHNYAVSLKILTFHPLPPRNTHAVKLVTLPAITVAEVSMNLPPFHESAAGTFRLRVGSRPWLDGSQREVGGGGSGGWGWGGALHPVTTNSGTYVKKDRWKVIFMVTTIVLTRHVTILPRSPSRFVPQACRTRTKTKSFPILKCTVFALHAGSRCRCALHACADA